MYFAYFFFNLYGIRRNCKLLMICFQASIYNIQFHPKKRTPHKLLKLCCTKKSMRKFFNRLKFLISVRPLRDKRALTRALFPSLYTIALFLRFLPYHNTMFKTIHTNVWTIYMIIKQMKLIVIMYMLSITVNKNLLLTPDYFWKKKWLKLI